MVVLKPFVCIQGSYLWKIIFIHWSLGSFIQFEKIPQLQAYRPTKRPSKKTPTVKKTSTDKTPKRKNVDRKIFEWNKTSKEQKVESNKRWQGQNFKKKKPSTGNIIESTVILIEYSSLSIVTIFIRNTKYYNKSANILPEKSARNSLSKKSLVHSMLLQ